MAGPLKTKPLALIVVVIAACALSWWLLAVPGPDSGSQFAGSRGGTEQTSAATPKQAEPTGQGDQRVAKRRSMPTIDPLQQSPEPALSDPVEAPGESFRIEDYSKSRMQIYFEFQRAVRSWTPEVFNQKSQQRESLTGEQIYEAYVYLRSCLDSLRSVARYQQRAEAMEQHQLRNSNDFSIEELQQTLDRYRSDLARCEGVGAELVHGLEPLLVEWLSVAAQRGYPQAQIAYHQSIRWLLSRKQMTVYRDPAAVHLYRRNAPVHLLAAITSGHSEALVEYSLALQEGILFEQDDELALAYARAAELAADGRNETATLYLAILENVLEPGQVAAARKLGRELCEQWCL